jgi:YD repeat-containing protein
MAYVYDEWNRVAQMTVNGETMSYTYDSYGNLSTYTDPLSRVTTFHYDAVQRVTKTTDAGGDVTVAYDGYGNTTTYGIGRFSDSWALLGDSRS